MEVQVVADERLVVALIVEKVRLENLTNVSRGVDPAGGRGKESHVRDSLDWRVCLRERLAGRRGGQRSRECGLWPP